MTCSRPQAGRVQSEEVAGVLCEDGSFPPAQ
jgi:hypothetical protein